jgi:hypothetical protein
MMTNLWVYDGELTGDTLTLNSEGPDWEAPGKLANYRDVIEFQDDDHRTLTAFVLGSDGTWSELMKVFYRRTEKS